MKNADEKETSDDSLIDRFLTSNPGSMRRNSPGALSPENESHDDILERSTTEDDELITETLANIYLQQKNYEKAIHCVQKIKFEISGKKYLLCNPN